ncbi:hypothetical protein [Paenibacillus sp. KS-LC4]|uniref:hypothetical protein n=1 Tax=Paenibacillus sp. KS-LC4 TaxID=2979727 RepID=UPI0030D31CE8
MKQIKPVLAVILILLLIFNLTPVAHSQNIIEAGIENTNVAIPSVVESVYEDNGEVQEYMLAFEEKVDVIIRQKIYK